MVDNEEVINLTKKKKKKTVNLKELLDEPADKEDDANVPPPETNEGDDELDLSKLKKKKKKKKTGFTLDGDDNKENGDLSSTAPSGEAVEELDLSGKKKASKLNEGEVLDETELANDLEEVLKLKRKKKKEKVSFLEPGEEPPTETDVSIPIGEQKWSGSDRDYTYDELLVRVFDIMRRKNPEMVAGEKKRFIMKPPQCARVGTKKTSFVNFNDICLMLHRQPKHVLAFILAELGTSGSVDGNNQLIIKGRFQQKQLESVLRRYIKEYVTCHTCKSPDTLLERDVRLYFLRCRVCQSRCSVATIKSGFQAVTNKRARIRAKAVA